MKAVHRSCIILWRECITGVSTSMGQINVEKKAASYIVLSTLAYSMVFKGLYGVGELVATYYLKLCLHTNLLRVYRDSVTLTIAGRNQ